MPKLKPKPAPAPKAAKAPTTVDEVLAAINADPNALAGYLIDALQWRGLVGQNAHQVSIGTLPPGAAFLSASAIGRVIERIGEGDVKVEVVRRGGKSERSYWSSYAGVFALGEDRVPEAMTKFGGAVATIKHRSEQVEEVAPAAKEYKPVAFSAKPSRARQPKQESETFSIFD